VFFGWLIRDEVLGTVEVLGGALIVLGVSIVVTAAAPIRRIPAGRPAAPRPGRG